MTHDVMPRQRIKRRRLDAGYFRPIDIALVIYLPEPQEYKKRTERLQNHHKMFSQLLLCLLPLIAANPVSRNNDAPVSLAKAKNRYFGTAYQSFYPADGRFLPVLESQFNQYTPENELKWEVVQPQRGVFNWTGADLVSSKMAELIDLCRSRKDRCDRSWSHLGVALAAAPVGPEHHRCKRLEECHEDPYRCCHG